MRKLLLSQSIFLFILFNFFESYSLAGNPPYAGDSLTITYAKKDSEELKMDVFSPKNPKGNLPLVIYVHGGGFSGGNRRGGIKFCKEMVQEGYVAATISYRLYMKGKSFSCDQQLGEKIKAIQIASNDLRSAVKYFIDHQDELNIDPEKIIISGSSAGAETILQSAFWPMDKMDFDEPVLDKSFKFAGLISFAGALMDLNLINQSTAVPTLLFHGTCDNLVPYATAAHHYCEWNAPGWLMLFGSHSIAEKIREVGGSVQLFTFCGAGHEIAGQPLRTNLDDIKSFIREAVLEGKKIQGHEIIPTKNCNSKPIPNGICE
ncbi:alpha/beta hydrolase [Flexithrix dorotheae]|uniref:alpha/beta hydrolase n=1 Tax=Flexithrix dorotheae TaxID=70993 RepID=UPI00037A918E|nr:alpha/beta hydrolase [Flexithrix dorotheae]